MAEVKWIKITTDVFDDEKILLIESMPSADSIITIWFKLLILAGKQNNNGVFMMSNKLPFTDEMLATIFRRDLNTVRLALKTFEEFGMIEVVDNVITIPNWNKHQTLDAYEKKKERDRLYQQNRRKKQKNLIEQKSLDKSSYVAISDKEEDKEEDKEKENIKENSLSPDSKEPFNFEDAWEKTFSIYPKKTAYSTSKTAWMDKVLEVIEENQPDIARLLYKATEAYLSDYQERNPDDTDFRYIPKYVDWLKNDCDYWLQIAEKRGDCS
jgi:predicted phage replisome organizer|nr:MAG TPA: replisome organizer [Caudoviricetes sp.]